MAESAFINGLFDLSGKLALVTGASGGLGRHMARALASAGATVVLVGRRMDALESAASMITSSGGKAYGKACDVARTDEIRRLKDEVEREFGPVDILVNGAGTTAMRHSIQLSEEEWDRVLDVNLKAMFFASQIFGESMIARRRGKIINIASVTSEIGLPGRAAYAASKGGVLLLTRTLGIEWAPYQVNVNAIGPGFFKTNINAHLFDDQTWRENLLRQIPMGRPGTPEDLDGVTVFLASPASDYVNGQVFYVDGGYLAGETNLNLPGGD